MADATIVLKMPVSDYGSVKMSLEAWYNQFMICPIGILSIILDVFAGVRLTKKTKLWKN